MPRKKQVSKKLNASKPKKATALSATTKKRSRGRPKDPLVQAKKMFFVKLAELKARFKSAERIAYSEVLSFLERNRPHPHGKIHSSVLDSALKKLEEIYIEYASKMKHSPKGTQKKSAHHTAKKTSSVKAKKTHVAAKKPTRTKSVTSA